MFDRIAGALGYEKRNYEKRNYTEMIIAAAFAQATDGVAVIGALEAAAGIIGRALASATVTGDGADNFDAETLLSIGRSLIIKGQYAGLITPNAALTELHEFDVEPAGVVGQRPRIRYTIKGGGKVATTDAVFVRYSVLADGSGAGVLQNARGLYAIAAQLERVLSHAASSPVGSVMPLPKISGKDQADAEKREAALKDALAGLKGKMAFVPTLMQGSGRQAGVPQPKRDYEQIRIQPEIKSEWLAACEMTEKTIYRAVGIPLTMLNENTAPTRESLRMFQTMTIEPFSKLIVEAARLAGIEINLDFGQASRFDLAGRARAFGILVSNGYDDELAAEITGFPIE